ncbi:protein phosphatase 2C domain-containing protein [Salipaludibacillus daqingensis]|uniref:protein phosphatase 2C domain-containing protein n=1 Tax=Salipaludibacillus daqingensis TaxID=3041001 RepID=UPI002473A238|nr:protein phosphatase 2C domain-containing protein [Salipaludibacillus daqingensis]
MKKLYAYTEKGTGKFNEDAVGLAENIAWVIDGATSIFPTSYLSHEKNDIVWIVEQVEKWFPTFIDHALSLEEILKKTMEQVREEALKTNPHIREAKGYELPTFTVVLLRQIEDKLEYFILGDSGLMIESENTIKHLTDTRLEEFNDRNKKAFDELKGNYKLDDPKVLKVLQNQRKLLNTEEGYWIGSIDGRGISHGIKGEMKLNKKTRVLCFSDGFSRIFDLFHVIDIDDFSLDVDFVKDTIQQIRTIEKDDSECTTYPRPKKSDDLSVILLEMT